LTAPHRNFEKHEKDKLLLTECATKIYDVNHTKTLLFLKNGSGVFPYQKLDYCISGGVRTFAFVALEVDGCPEIIFTLKFLLDILVASIKHIASVNEAEEEDSPLLGRLILVAC